MTEPNKLFDTTLVFSNHGLVKANWFCKLTASFRIKPDFFIVGAQKAGTSSLAAYLSGCPEIISPKHKEISFFNNTSRFDLGEKWYASFFATKFIKTRIERKLKTKCFTFDASANYFEEIKSAQRIKKFNANAKIIIILRDPTERAWSHYKMAVKYGFESKSFEEALELEKLRIKANKDKHNFAFQRLAYRTKGEYINYLVEWKQIFGDNLKIIFYEELISNKRNILQEIHDFIGIKTKADFKKLKQVNKGSNEVLNSEIKSLLHLHYADYNTKLSKFLNRELPW